MQVACIQADILRCRGEDKTTHMNDRTLVALDTDDSYFNDWMIDLFSLERRTSELSNQKMWTAVKPTYISILVRDN
jgi:hypothetical protein